jgi:hypothetical protein
MPIATERARGLVIGKEEDDIGTLGLQFAKEEKEEAGETERSIVHFICWMEGNNSKCRTNGNPYGMRKE